MTAAARQGLAPVRQVLDNGAVVIVKAAATIPAVTINATVRAGSLYESDAELGVSQLVSRVIDRGSARRTAEQIAGELEGRGVTPILRVTRHALSLVCTCLAGDFELVLDVVGDLLTGPVFPDDEVAKRRGELLASIRQDADSPAATATRELLGLLYPGGHPCGRPLKGRADTVERLDRGALVRFHRARFAPSTLSLALVGDLEPERAREAAERVFGPWRARPEPEPALPRAPATAERREAVVPMMGRSQVDIAYGFSTISRKDPGYCAYELFNTALGQYAIGGRLGDSIRERQGMAYYAFSVLDASLVESPLIIRAGVNPANVERTIASIDAEVARMARDGLTAQELADCQQYLIGSMPRTLETNTGIAAFLQTAEFFGLGLDYDLRAPERLRAVTLEQANAAARRTLDPERAAVAVAGPYLKGVTPQGAAGAP
jgi:zinc protease